MPGCGVPARGGGAVEQGGVWGRLSVRVVGTPSGPPETRSSTHARLSAGLGDWVGGTAWMRGLRGVLRGAGGHPPPMCTPRQWPDSARSGRGAPHFGGARLACIGVYRWGLAPSSGFPEIPQDTGDCPPRPAALGTWPAASGKAGAFRPDPSATRVWLSPGSRATASLGQASPLWQRPGHHTDLATGCGSPGLGAAAVGGQGAGSPVTARPHQSPCCTSGCLKGGR